MAQLMMVMIASPIPSSTVMTGCARSRGMTARAAPNISAKKISASMSMLAAAATGLRGTMLTKVLMPNSGGPDVSMPCALPENFSISSLRVCSGKPLPGLIVLTSVRPRTAASSVDSKK